MSTRHLPTPPHPYTNYYIPGQYMGKVSDCEVEDYDAVQFGILLVKLMFWLFGETDSLFLQNKSELSWEVEGSGGKWREVGSSRAEVN